MPLKQTPFAMLNEHAHAKYQILCIAQKAFAALPLIMGILTMPVDVPADAMDVEVDSDVSAVPVDVVACVIEIEVGRTILIVEVENVECRVDGKVEPGAFAIAVDTMEVVVVIAPDTEPLTVPFCASARLMNASIWTCDFGLIPKTIPRPQ